MECPAHAAPTCGCEKSKEEQDLQNTFEDFQLKKGANLNTKSVKKAAVDDDDVNFMYDGEGEEDSFDD